jgi:hypothetical protein
MLKGIAALKGQDQKISKEGAFRYFEAGKRGDGLVPNKDR